MRKVVIDPNAHYGMLRPIYEIASHLRPTQLDGLKCVWWQCLCDCGKEAPIRACDLNSGNKQSCGCLKAKQLRERTLKHGRSKPRRATGKDDLTYIVWMNLKGRCLNPNSRGYRWYGAKGIKICDRWLHSFENFLVDMGERPGREYSIDRINSSGDYEPSNCRWILKSEQQANVSNNRRITINGETKHLAYWVKHYGLPRHVFYLRVAKGWNEQEAVTVPYEGGLK